MRRTPEENYGEFGCNVISGRTLGRCTAHIMSRHNSLTHTYKRRACHGAQTIGEAQESNCGGAREIQQQDNIQILLSVSRRSVHHRRVRLHCTPNGVETLSGGKKVRNRSSTVKQQYKRERDGNWHRRSVVLCDSSTTPIDDREQCTMEQWLQSACTALFRQALFTIWRYYMLACSACCIVRLSNTRWHGGHIETRKKPKSSVWRDLYLRDTRLFVCYFDTGTWQFRYDIDVHFGTVHTTYTVHLFNCSKVAVSKW